MTKQAFSVKYWNNLEEARQLVHVIQSNRVAVDIHNLHDDLNDIGDEFIGRTWLDHIESAAETGNRLVVSGLSDTSSTTLDKETAKNLLGAIRRRMNPSEVFDFL